MGRLTIFWFLKRYFCGLQGKMAETREEKVAVAVRVAVAVGLGVAGVAVAGKRAGTQTTVAVGVTVG